MNIGGYNPDGNIMTVPEIKEIITEGVDISELKETVETIGGNVTTLNEAVGELETDLAGAVADINEVSSDVETVTLNLSDLATIVNGLASNKIGKYVAGESISYDMQAFGFVTNGSKDLSFYIPDSKIDPTLNYSIDDLALCTRFIDSTYGYVLNGETYEALGANVKPFVTDGSNVITSISNIVLSKTDKGLNIRITLSEAFKTTNAGTTTVKNNTPVSVVVAATVIVS